MISSCQVRIAGGRQADAVENATGDTTRATNAVRRHPWILTLCLTAAVVAQPPGTSPEPIRAPSVRYFGVTCGPASPEGSSTISILFGQVPGHTVVEGYLYGTWAYVDAYDCKMRGQAYLLVGGSNQQAGGVPLPYLLPLALTMNHPCLAQVSADAIVVDPVGLKGKGSNYASAVASRVPNLAALSGQKLYLQWIVHRWQTGMNCSYYLPYFFTSNAAEVTLRF